MLTIPTFNLQPSTQFFRSSLPCNIMHSALKEYEFASLSRGRVAVRPRGERGSCGSDCGHSHFSFVSVKPAGRFANTVSFKRFLLTMWKRDCRNPIRQSVYLDHRSVAGQVVSCYSNHAQSGRAAP